MVIITSINVGILGRKVYKNNNNTNALILSISGFINSVLWFLRIPIAISDLAISAFSPNSINIILFICISLLECKKKAEEVYVANIFEQYFEQNKVGMQRFFIVWPKQKKAVKPPFDILVFLLFTDI
jgi:hypothetical protein